MKLGNGRSLKTAVTKASVQTAVLTAVIVLAGAMTYYLVAQNIARNSVQESLLNGAKKHIEQILPSFLLPEQRGALTHQLDRIRNVENLTQANVIESSAEIPAKFRRCELGASIRFCEVDGGSEIGLIAPIVGGDQTFGYLFESKAISGSYTFQSM